MTLSPTPAPPSEDERLQALRHTRAVFLLAAVIYPLWYIVCLFVPGIEDSLAGRCAVGLLFALGYAGSYLPWMQRYAQKVLVALTCVMAFHLVWLMRANNFHLAYIIGLFVVETAVNACFNDGRSGLVFTAAVVGSTCFALRSAPPQIPGIIVLSGLVTIFTVQYVLLRLRLAITRQVRQLEAERQKVRGQIIASAGLSALGEMAGGVAHEVNNPLAIIVGHAQLLEQLLDSEKFDKKAETMGILEIIRNTAWRIDRIVRGLKSLSRDASSDPMTSARIESVIDDTLSVCAEKFKHRGVRLVVEGDADAQVLCRPTQLSQVLLNLLSNALDAVESAPRKHVAVSVVRNGLDVELRVSDSGAGVEAGLRDKIFQPFFTTKDVGKGTGLGLSISRRIVEGHRGALELDVARSETTFVIRLPVAEAAEPSLRRAA